MLRRHPLVLFVIIVLGIASSAQSSAFFGAGPVQQDLIVHPNGYTGVGGPQLVTVCVDPASPFAQEMIAPLERAVATWSALSPTNGNISAMPQVPPASLDFETVALHEIGHCMGLGHPNLNLFGVIVSGFTSSGLGTNGVEDIDNGDDDISGSADDLRNDDVNANWFRTADNHPFLLGGPVDATTYSRDLVDLPMGDTYSANANSSVARTIFRSLTRKQ